MSLVKSRFYWPGMDGDIEKYVRNCPKCIRRKAQGKTAAKLVVGDSTYPMDLVCMDFLSLEMSAGGYEHILVITVSKVANIRNRYNQVPHLTQDTNGKVTNSQKTP